MTLPGRVQPRHRDAEADSRAEEPGRASGSNVSRRLKTQAVNPSLFTSPDATPLAARMRPRTLEEFVGQSRLSGQAARCAARSRRDAFRR